VKYWLITQFTEMDQLDDLAKGSEELGFYGLMLGDHLVSFDQQNDEYLYTDDGGQLWQHDTHWPDPWVQVAALAKITSRLKFMTSVYVLPMHDTITAAKAVGTAAYISGGRVILGIGTGWQRGEFELVGRQFDKRGKVMDEQIEVMQKLWSGEMVEHHGRYHDFQRLQMSPPPGAAIPLYGSGLAPVALRRSAGLDGWIAPSAYAYADVEELIEPMSMEDMGVSALMLCPWMRSRYASPSTLQYKLERMDVFAGKFLQ
jgi:probable F420-dependent oxidoreductase